jgi:hypothetical protein
MLGHTNGGVPVTRFEECDHACAGCSKGHCRDTGTLQWRASVAEPIIAPAQRSIRCAGINQSRRGTDRGSMQSQSREPSKCAHTHDGRDAGAHLAAGASHAAGCELELWNDGQQGVASGPEVAEGGCRWARVVGVWWSRTGAGGQTSGRASNWETGWESAVSAAVGRRLVRAVCLRRPETRGQGQQLWWRRQRRRRGLRGWRLADLMATGLSGTMRCEMRFDKIDSRESRTQDSPVGRHC